MSNEFADLPVPAGDGVGAAVDVSTFAARKTINVTGSFVSAITVEFSEDNVDWAPLSTFTVPGQRTLYCAARYMRIRQSGWILGTGNADVAADTSEGQFSAVNVPAGDGVGTALDTSLFPEFFTFIVAGAFTGGITIEFSADGTNWSPVLGFSNIGSKSKEMTAFRVRVRRTGVDPALPGTPTVTVGAVSPQAGAGAGAGSIFTFDPAGTNNPAEQIYTTWTPLHTAWAAKDGYKTIRFIGACTIPLGAWGDMSLTTWERPGGPLEYYGTTAVTIADGATFTGIPILFDGIVVSNAGAAPFTVVDGSTIRMRNGARLSVGIGAGDTLFDGSGLGAAEFVDLYIDSGSVFGNNSTAVLDLANNAELYAYMYEDSILAKDSVSGGAGSNIYYYMYATSAQLETQTFAGTIYAQEFHNTPRWRIRPAVGTAPSTAPITGIAMGDYLRLNATAGVITQALPKSVGLPAGSQFLNDSRCVIVEETSGVNGVTIDAYGTETIEGALTYSLPPGAKALLVNDGVSDWSVVAVDINFVLNRHNTYTKAQGVAKVSLVDAATIATDCSLGNVFEVTLGGNRALGLPTNLVSGFTYMWIIKQDAGAPRTLTYNAIFKFPGGVAPTLSTGSGDVDVITAAYDGTNLLCVFQADFS